MAPLTSTSSLRAKQSPRQPRPDGRGRGCGEGPWAQRAAVDWPVPGPASAEKQTRSRGPGLGADAVSRGRERLEQRIGHVHPWLLAPPSAWGRVGALELAQAEQWSSCQPGQGGALRSGEVSPAAPVRTTASGWCAGMDAAEPGPWSVGESCRACHSRTMLRGQLESGIGAPVPPVLGVAGTGTADHPGQGVGRPQAPGSAVRWGGCRSSGGGP